MTEGKDYLNSREAEEKLGLLWQQKSGEFTPVNRPDSPLLNRLIDECARRGGGEVFEGGCGAGVQALELARRGLEVKAVDFSPEAIAIANKNKEEQQNGRAEELPVSFRVGDFRDALQQLPDGSLTAAYFNAVFHFFSADERREAYALVWKKLRPGGVLAISFKGGGDALEELGVPVAVVDAGVVVEDEQYTPGAHRLFVYNAVPLAAELEAVGFEVKEAPMEWQVESYNKIDSKLAKFVGLVAAKPEA